MSLSHTIGILTEPDREVDARIAHEFDTYKRYAEALSDNLGTCVVKSVTYRPRQDDAAIKIGMVDKNGGLIYSDKLPAYTGSHDAASQLLPDENWTLSRQVNEDNDTTYVLTLRGKHFEASTAALVICLAVTHLREYGLL